MAIRRPSDLVLALAVLVSVCCATGLGASPVPEPSTPNYQRNLTTAADWIVTRSILPDGAITSGSGQIIPYFGNLAAIGLTKNPRYYPQVKKWMQWYVRHMNKPDKWGLTCTTYDYTVSNGVETSKDDADSTDSYAATFATLAWSFWQTQDPDAQAYVKSLKTSLDCMGGVIVQTMQPNGLTIAKPDYKTLYLMDNCEVYEGLVNLARLMEAFGDPQRRDYYRDYSDKVRSAIQTVLWDPQHKTYLPFAGSPPAAWKTWYPDATAQLFPILSGVVAPTDGRARQIYASFQAQYPNWSTLGFPGADPWVLIAGAAALEGDTAGVNKYVDAVQKKFVSRSFPFPWQSAESGWFIRVNSYMLGGRPF